MEFMKIDWESGIPVWLQVKQGILHAILTGKFKKGDQLPTVRQLAVVLSINYNTVNKAYMDLEREGFIVSRRGKGTFISENNPLNKKVEDKLIEGLVDGFLEKIISAGVSPTQIVGFIEKRLKEMDYGRE